MKYHIVAQTVFPGYTEGVCSYCFTKVIQMNAVKDEDMLRKAIRNFVQNGSPQKLKDALKNLQKDDSINNSQSAYKQLTPVNGNKASTLLSTRLKGISGLVITLNS